MSVTGIEGNFQALYAQLMKVNFLAMKRPVFGANPTKKGITQLINKGEPSLPAAYRTGYVDPLKSRLDGIFARTGKSDPLTLETLTGCIYQHSQKPLQPELDRFLAVASDLYVSFLNRSTRRNLQIPLSEAVPPLTVFQSNPRNGPFTIPSDQIAALMGGNIGVVSLPATFAPHPFLYGSLVHEICGHDVIHADHGLMQQMREELYTLFPNSADQWLAVLWDYWMDEAAADVYGVLNMGPSFGFNLAMLLAVFIGQFAKPPAKQPGLRSESGQGDTQAMDVHPTDLLRMALVQGVIQASPGLSPSTRDSYISQISALASSLGHGATTIGLTGQAVGVTGKSIYFQESYPLSEMQDAARQVGAMLVTTIFPALAGHTIQDIETWDDGDENAAVKIAARLQADAPVADAGDDAQLLAGLTLALMQRPAGYAAYTKLINAALDSSFANDPTWGGAGLRDMMVIKPTRTLKNPEVKVDPYAAEVIDYNPLDEDAALSIGLGVTMVNQHAIVPIPWPQGLAPKLDTSFNFNGPDAELPKADFVIFTWTSAEANAMAAAFTPGSWAMPAKGMTGGWYKYTNQWDAKYAGRFTGTSPARDNPYIGKYMPVLIGGRKVLLFKSNFHLARDNATMPVKDMFKQVIEQVEPKLVITSGTAGAIGSKMILGDAVICNTTLFDLERTFKHIPANGQSFTSGYVTPTNGHLTSVGPMIAANAASVKAAHQAYPGVVKTFQRDPKIFTAATPQSQLGGPPVIVTTDIFAFDVAGNEPYELEGKGVMVEMGDAVLGMAIQEMGHPTKWLAIRNASDPQMPTKDKGTSSDVYKQYGYWTSLTSTLASWACVLDF